MTSDSYINWLQNIIADNAIPFYKEHITTISENTFNQLSGEVVEMFNEKHLYYAYRTVVDVIGRILGLKKWTIFMYFKMLYDQFHYGIYPISHLHLGAFVTNNL